MKKAGKIVAGRRQTRAESPAGVRRPDRIAADLLGWYARARRDLPWRRSQDPYRVWVSEIMLQQTQVERVRDFFVRFIDRFPTVEALAAAPAQEVLRLWEGLGYYRRARQLHAAAQRIVAEHGGTFPRDVAGLRTLPGIGRYTAAAIASIAMGLPEPIVEANSRRVIARLAGHAAPLDGHGGDEPIWAIAAALVPPRHPGRFNQALMDLGALVCLPDRPLCEACPIASHCNARQTRRTAEIPAKPARRTVRQLRESAVVVRRAGRVLVEQRGPGEWWEGLWDFPRLPHRDGSASKLVTEAESLRPLACAGVERIGSITHTVTHHRITLAVLACDAARPGRTARGRRWVTIASLERLAMTAPGRRIARMISD